MIMEKTYRNPFPTVDVIIEHPKGIVMIKRKNPPPGWALPGGFVEYGESLEEAAVRECKEETGLDLTLSYQLHSYSDPKRDPRHHTITTVYVGRAEGTLSGADDASEARVFAPDALPPDIAFDHRDIIADYLKRRLKGDA